MDPAVAKQQIVDRLKQANNVLVTVSNNPSVDQLASCIGTTLLLNKLQKHATAVFSGAVPSTIEFLQPEKTLEKTTDSLRDFIISLDKSKADKLRYKVEDQVVRIFITPYRSKITADDLVFSEGDFNVEVVLALGVQDRSQIDAAITAHGRILHDATVISVNAGSAPATNMGSINWQDPNASSLAEMIVSISEAFGPSLIDNQMATAFLTGIVAQTDRFSNDKTTPRVMTMSAQLMAAGANQQLIATKLDESAPVKVPQAAAKPVVPPDSGVLNIPHDKFVKQPVPLTPPPVPEEIKIDAKGNLITKGANPKPGSKSRSELSRPSTEVGAVSADKADKRESLLQGSLPGKPPTPKTVKKQELRQPEPPSPAVTTPPPVKTPEPPKIESLPAPPPTLPPSPLPTLPPSPPPASPPFAPPPAAPTASSRAYLDPTKESPALGSAFSSVTDQSSLHSLGGSNDIASGPLAPDLFSGSKSGAGDTPTVDNARSAVASAIQSQPFDPAFDRVASLGAEDVGVDIHPETKAAPAEPRPETPTPPLPTNDTPSLELPISPVSKPAVTGPAHVESAPPPRPAEDSTGPAPPPGPPPLMPTGGGLPPSPPTA